MIRVYGVFMLLVATMVLVEHFSMLSPNPFPWVTWVRFGMAGTIYMTVLASVLSKAVRRRFISIAHVAYTVIALETLMEFYIWPDKNYGGLWLTLITMLSGMVFFNPGAYFRFSAIWATGLLVAAVALWNPGSPETTWIGVSLISLMINTLVFAIRSRDREKISLLTSFTEFNPTPAIGLSKSGELLYFNPAAEAEFPGIAQYGSNHILVRSLARLLELESVGDGERTKQFVFGDKTLEIRYSRVVKTHSYRVFISDITPQLAREEEMASREDMYHRLVEGSNEGLLILRHEGDLMYANQRFFELFGVKSFTRLDPAEADTPEENELYLFIQKLRKRYKGSPEVFETLIHRGHEELLVLVSMQPYIGRRRLPEGFVVTLTDLSMMEKTEEAMRLRMVQMEKFLDHTTHDLQGPVSTIRGLIGLAFKEDVPKNLIPLLDQVNFKAEEISRALIDLLDVSRLGRAVLEPNEIHLRTLVQEITQRMGYLAEYDKVQVINGISPDLTFVSDRRYIEAILANLISNGIKYHRKEEAQSFVRVEAQLQPGCMVISVTDNGEGIPYHLQPVVFEMFFRGNRRSSGTGLGLYIVKLSVEKLDGDLIFESMPGMGTTFTLTLPLIKNPGTARSQQSISESRLT
jgi:PAS domain S-box-containing protein